MAIEYLEKIAAKYPDKKIFTMGHSKGGNLTFYSALKCSDEVSERILCAYCFDGPGLSEELVTGARYNKMKDRLEVLLPQASYIGIMFDRGESYGVIKSTGKGLFQHDPFTWVVIGRDFERLEELSGIGKIHEVQFRTRLDELTVEDRQIVADAIFDAIASSGIKTLSELRQKGGAKIIAMIRNYTKNDKKKRELVRKLLFNKK
jgi:hypothetical protein